jgi:8-oxo-dGTP pyrophosphatase MutT (NUDIX family)
MKAAVCLFFPADDRFLAVSRRHDSALWGMPGGKVDPGETNIEGLLREVREEVGLTLPPTSLQPLYVGTSAGDTDFWVTTYLFDDPNFDFTTLNVKVEEGLQFSWLSEWHLTNSDVSPFALYNRKVFEAYSIYKGRHGS